MELKVGRKIALVVAGDWYREMARYNILKSPNEDTTDLLSGVVDDVEAPNGMWIKPDEKYSEFPKGSMLVPWHVIIGAVLLGPDEEKKLGFG